MMDLFDRSREYDEMLARGLRLSGEDRDYFIAGRVRDLLRQLPPSFDARRILDFGCGTGDTSAYLASVFTDAEILGVDTAEATVRHATRCHGSDRVRFEPLRSFVASPRFDLCYTNGVFHHIEPSKRDAALRLIREALVDGGRLALMENNPWNPGTRMVMRRIPFDRDAIPISPPQAKRLLLRAGFEVPVRARFLFYFPRVLSRLRFLEPSLAAVPLGAQYYMLATKAR